MALIQCAECGKDVSTQAKKCPSCGAKVVLPKKPTSPLLKLFLVGAVAASFVGAYVAHQPDRDAEVAEQARVAALSPQQRAAEAAHAQAVAASAAFLKAAAGKAEAAAKARADDVGMAEVTCSMEAEKRANDPSSMEWIREERKFAYTSKDLTHATSLQGLRAKNAMGGLVKTVVRCDLVKDSSGWNVAKFKEL